MTNDKAMEAALELFFNHKDPQINYGFDHGFEAGWKASRLHTLTEDPIVNELIQTIMLSLGRFNSMLDCSDLWHSRATMGSETCRQVLAKFDAAVASIKDGVK